MEMKALNKEKNRLTKLLKGQSWKLVRKGFLADTKFLLPLWTVCSILFSIKHFNIEINNMNLTSNLSLIGSLGGAIGFVASLMSVLILYDNYQKRVILHFLLKLHIIKKNIKELTSAKNHEKEKNSYLNKGNIKNYLILLKKELTDKKKIYDDLKSSIDNNRKDHLIALIGTIALVLIKFIFDAFRLPVSELLNSTLLSAGCVTLASIIGNFQSALELKKDQNKLMDVEDKIEELEIEFTKIEDFIKENNIDLKKEEIKKAVSLDEINDLLEQKQALLEYASNDKQNEPKKLIKK